MNAVIRVVFASRNAFEASADTDERSSAPSDHFQQLDHRGGGAETFASIAFAGGVATGIFALGIPTGGVVVALGVDHLGASVAAALNALEATFFIGAELSAIVLLGAAAVVALRTAVLPRWWAGMSILLAAWLAIGPIGWIGVLAGIPLWTITTSLMLARADRLAPVPTVPATLARH